MSYVAFVAEGHSNDSLLQEHNCVHAYYPTVFYREIAQQLKRHGLTVHTIDVLQSLNESPLVEVYFESQAVSQAQCPRVMIAMENPQINPLNASECYLQGFAKVLTWNRKLSHLPSFEYLAYVPLEPIVPDEQRCANRSKLATMVCSNKIFKTPVNGDLYAERLRIVEWFEKNSPQDFDLYGQGWHKPAQETTILGKIRRSGRRLRNFLTSSPCYRTWRGPLHSKKDALSRAWFGFCYENSSTQEGYVTEKLLDTLAIGAVPIYLGAPDIQNYVPTDLFIDARNFSGISDLVAFCKAMPLEHRLRMIGEGHDFIYNSEVFSLKKNVGIAANAIVSAIHSSPAR